jgi:hypothetical protein
MRRRGGGNAWLMLASAMLLASHASPSAGQVAVPTPAPPSGDSAFNSAVEPHPDGTQLPESKPAGIKDWVEQRARTILSSSAERDRRLSVAAGSITPGSGFAAGARYRHLNAFGAGIGFEAGAMVSHRRYQQYAVAFGLLNARSTTLELDAADRRVGSLFNDSSSKEPGSALFVEARYRDYPQRLYYGSGITSREADRADYSLSGVSVEGVWQRQFHSSIGISVRGGVLDLRVGRGTNPTIVDFEERFLPAAVPGGIAQPRFVTVGAGLVRDTRAQPGAPDAGTLVGIAVRRFAGTDASGLDFTRVTLDLRGYTKPITPRGVLAMRALLSTDFTDGSSPTPFYLQQSLGGGDTIRGLAPYRFQDQALYVLTAEYRWRVHPNVEVAPFVDVGNTAPALSRLSWRSLKTGPGLAVRVRTEHRTLARLEWATSSEGYRLLVGTGAAF